jgi:hypothetical protein
MAKIMVLKLTEFHSFQSQSKAVETSGVTVCRLSSLLLQGHSLGTQQSRKSRDTEKLYFGNSTRQLPYVYIYIYIVTCYTM